MLKKYGGNAQGKQKILKDSPYRLSLLLRHQKIQVENLKRELIHFAREFKEVPCGFRSLNLIGQPTYKGLLQSLSFAFSSVICLGDKTTNLL